MEKVEEMQKVEEMPFEVAEVKETPVKQRRGKLDRKNTGDKKVATEEKKVETVGKNVKKPIEVKVNAQSALLKPVEENQPKPRR